MQKRLAKLLVFNPFVNGFYKETGFIAQYIVKTQHVVFHGLLNNYEKKSKQPV